MGFILIPSGVGPEEGHRCVGCAHLRWSSITNPHDCMQSHILRDGEVCGGPLRLIYAEPSEPNLARLARYKLGVGS